MSEKIFKLNEKIEKIFTFKRTLCVMLICISINWICSFADKLISFEDKPYPEEQYVEINGVPVYFEEEYPVEKLTYILSKVPNSLLKTISSLNIVNRIDSDPTANGLTDFRYLPFNKANQKIDIYIDSNRNKIGMGNTVHHEIGHVLDSSEEAYRYSSSPEWKYISKSEWSNDGYYSSPSESFAEAVSRYYSGELLEENKTQSYQYIDLILKNIK